MTVLEKSKYTCIKNLANLSRENKLLSMCIAIMRIIVKSVVQ